MDDPKAKANYIKYCETLRKVIKKLRNNTTVDVWQNLITK